MNKVQNLTQQYRSVKAPMNCYTLISARCGFEPRYKATVVSLIKNLYPYCSVLVGPTNGLERYLP